SHRAEVARVAHSNVRFGPLVRRKLRFPLDHESGTGGQPSVKRQEVDYSNISNAGERPDARRRLAEEPDDLAILPILAARQAHDHRQHVLSIEPRIDLLQSGEALHHQSGAHEQYERQRHLNDYEDVAQAAAARALPPGTLAAFLEHVAEVQAR